MQVNDVIAIKITNVSNNIITNAI